MTILSFLYPTEKECELLCRAFVECHELRIDVDGDPDDAIWNVHADQGTFNLWWIKESVRESSFICGYWWAIWRTLLTYEP